MLLPELKTPLPCRLHLRAINPERNVAREYLLDVQPDLFGHWIVELHWGRIGTRGQCRTLSFEHTDAASLFVRNNLARRRGAHRRIGTAYIEVGGVLEAVKQDSE